MANEARIWAIVKEELLELREKYSDARRTEIVDSEDDIDIEDLIAEEDMVVTKSNTGYLKRQPLSLYQSQHRGGKGKMAMQTREEDFVEQLFIASTHDFLLFFTNIGKVHWLKVYRIPQASRTARGKAAVNFLQLQPDEKISTVIPIRRFEVERYLIMATKKGIVKKTELTAYGNPRQTGIIALTLDEGDELIGVGVTSGDQEIFLGTRNGLSIRFSEDDVRSIGRTGRGVIGIRLDDDDEVVGMAVLSPDADILTATECGYGKRTEESEYRTQSRGGRGLINLRVTEKTGRVIGVRQVLEDDDVMLMSDQGNLVRIEVSQVSKIGRNTQGVRLISLNEDQRLVGLVRIEDDNGKDNDSDNGTDDIATAMTDGAMDLDRGDRTDDDRSGSDGATNNGIENHHDNDPTGEIGEEIE